jgi:hypothetical protein
MNKNANKKGSSDIRGKLILRGTNMTKWAKKNKIPLTTLHQAVHGTRAGIKTIRARQKLEEFLNAA